MANVIGQLSKHHFDPKIDYLKAAKKVIHYLKDMIYLKFKYRNILKSDRQIRHQTSHYFLISLRTLIVIMSVILKTTNQ